MTISSPTPLVAGRPLPPPSPRPSAPSPRRETASGRRLAIAFAGVDAVGGIGAVSLSATARQLTLGTAAFALVGTVTVLVGLAIAYRQPRNSLGWCLLAVPFLALVSNIASTYSVLDFRRHHGTLPLGDLAVLLQPMWAPCIVLFVFSLALFPDGRIPKERLVRAAFLALGLLSLVWMGGAVGLAVRGIVEHRLRVDSGGNLISQDRMPPGWRWLSITQTVLFPAAVASVLIWGVAQVRRFRGSRGIRRLQLRWLYGGIAIATAGSALALFTGGYFGVLILAILALPVTIGVAVLRYKLFEIDRVVSRTLAYLLVTGLLVGVYAGSVTLATRVLPFSSPIGVAASTIVVAALFNPLRRRVQRLVDRRFNRAGYDVERLVSAFAARLRESVDATVVRNDLLSVVDTAFEPASSALWLRPREAASSSRPASG